MEAHGGVHLPAGGGGWQRPPWSIPHGRRPRFGQRLRSGLGLDALYMAGGSGMYLTVARTSWIFGDTRAFTIFFTSIAGLAFAYGITVILTSGRRRRMVPAWLGLNVSREARAWFGIGIVIPLVIGGVGALFFSPPSYPPTAAGELLFTVFYVAPAVVAAGCVLASRACSYRAIKETIVSGNAPVYFTTNDHFWWWDGVQWASTAVVAPARAVQSPDGNYWWTGRDWCALPALPWRVSKSARDASARGAVS